MFDTSVQSWEYQFKQKNEDTGSSNKTLHENGFTSFWL